MKSARSPRVQTRLFHRAYSVINPVARLQRSFLISSHGWWATTVASYCPKQTPQTLSKLQ